MIRKRLGGSLFNLQGYEPDDGDWVRASISEATDRDAHVAAIEALLLKHKAPRLALTAICNAADEMLTNAIYNAPVDSAGKPRYAQTDRKVKVSLSKGEEVDLWYGLSKGRFVICVGDNFGRLRRRHMAESIRRCVVEQEMIENKDGGAGLGLFMIARTAHEFSIHIDPGSRTEVVAMWKLDRQRLREHRSYNSLHIFKQQRQLRRSRGQHVAEWEGSTTDPGMF